MKLTPLQQYIFLGVLVFMGFSYVYYQYIITPINIRIKADNDQKKGVEDKLKQAIATQKDYEKFKDNADSTQRELTLYQNRIPPTVENIKMMQTIYLLQSRSGVVLTSLQFQAPQTVNDFVQLPAAIRFNSDFKGLLAFLYQTSITSPVMTVQNLSISPGTVVDHPSFTLQVQMIINGIQANLGTAGAKK